MVTVAAGTTWGDATPCYASHMMLVLLYGYEKKDIFHGLYGYEINIFFIVVLIPKVFRKADR